VEVRGESPLGNLIADGQLAATPTSVAAFMNPGGVRADIAAGPITYEEAFTVQPFGNYLSQLTLTGAQVQCLLEQQFAAGRVLQPAGITYEVDPNGTTGATGLLGSGKYACEGTRVPDESVSIGGRTVTDEGSYRITVNNFLADGGDGFTILTEGSSRKDVDRPEDDLAAFIQYLGSFDSPTTAPATDRISVLSGS